MKVVRGRHAGVASVPWTEHFSGTAWMDLLLHERIGGPDRDVSITSVTFTPGVRTHWHRHHGGQVLLVVSGEGWVGSRPDRREVVRAGDLVWSPPGEDHWHGATDQSTLTHLAVTLGATEWHDEPVVTA